MSANYDAAVQARGTADVTQSELQSVLMDPDPDEGRVDTIRAAAQHHEAAALFYAVMALVDVVTDTALVPTTVNIGGEGPQGVDVVGLASKIEQETRRQHPTEPAGDAGGIRPLKGR